jgi:hypothetical protein
MKYELVPFGFGVMLGRVSECLLSDQKQTRDREPRTGREEGGGSGEE